MHRIVALCLLASVVLGVVGWSVLQSEVTGEREESTSVEMERDSVASEPDVATAVASELPTRATTERAVCETIVRARLAGEWVPIERAKWMPWKEADDREARTKYSIPIARIDRSTLDILPEADGSLRLPAASEDRLIAVMAAGASIQGRLVKPSDEEVVIELEPFEVLRCKVIDAQKNPVSGAWVTARYDLFNTKGRDERTAPELRVAKAFFRLEGISDAQGMVAIEHRTRGMHCVTASKGGMSTCVVQTTNLPTPPGNEFVLELFAAAEVVGRVVDDATNEPLRDVRIELAAFQHREYYASAGIGFSDERGEFRIPDAIAGFGSLYGIVAKTDYASESVVLGEVTAGEVRRVDLRLKRPEPFVGIVRDLEGRPVVGARISAGNQDLYPGGIEEALTDADGRFEFVSIEKDRPFMIVPQQPGFELRWIDVSVPWRQPFEVRLEPVLPLKGRLKAEGYPLVDAKIRIVRDDPLIARYFERWGEVDPATGEFVITDIPSGTYNLDALAEGHAPSQLLRLSLLPGQERKDVEIELERGFPIEGRVVDDRSSAPIADATIFWGDVAAASQEIAGVLETATKTDTEGRFAIAAAPRGRRVVLLVRHDGHASQVVDFEAHDSLAKVTREVRMRPEAVLEVRATLPDGRPADRLYGTVVGSDDLSRTASSQDGVLRFERLPADRYGMTVSLDSSHSIHDRLTIERHGIDVVEGEITKLDVAFGGGATIQARVRGRGFAEYGERFLIVVRKTDEPDLGRTLSDMTNYGTGDATMPGITPGEYLVYAASPTGFIQYRAARAVKVMGNETLDLDFEISDRMLTARVVDEHGAPIDSVRVSVRSAGIGASVIGPESRDENWRNGRTDNRGATAICGFEPGPLEYVLERAGFARQDGRIEVDPALAERSLEHTFRLEKECRLAVRVTDREGHELSGVDLSLSSPGHRRLDWMGREQTQSKLDGLTADGRALFHGLGTDEYTLAASLDGYFPLVTRVACTSGAALDVEVSLRRLAPFAVALRDAQGAPLREIECGLTDLETNETVAQWLRDGRIVRGDGRTDRDGVLRFEALPLGRYRLTAPGIAAEVEVRSDFDADEFDTLRASP